MSRRNIFQRIADGNSLEVEANRLDRLFAVEKLFWCYRITETMEKYVYKYCFPNWKNRGHCLDLDDYLDVLGYDDLLCDAETDIESYLTLIELILNMWKIAEQSLSLGNAGWECSEDFYHLHDIMTEELSHYNHKAVYDEENEQVLVVEDKPEVTAVAEIVETALALDIVRYNHHSMSGNVTGKKTILLAMGSELEPKRKVIEARNRKLASDIFYMLNNLNLRHNNCKEGDKNYREVVAKMKETDLESWYDELFQMMLLAFLEVDQIEREKRVEELKGQIEGETV